MIAIPAIDLRDGACVQLVGGSYASEKVRIDDAIGVAHRWAYAGFSRLHLVDLDAATGKGDNEAVVEEILRASPLEVQVGGGVRTMERVEHLLSRGARRVVVGTRGVEDRQWLVEVAAAYPESVVLAADVRDRCVVTRGWATSTRLDVIAFIEDLISVPLGGVMVTAVHREGLMRGPDLRLMEDVVRASTVPVIASGGIASRHDLDDLEAAGVDAAVIGMALYTGALDPNMLAEEYAQ
jgi:phosphoribosylformimino-5-aminoimidazole carboxamide ribotide isomerase